MIRAWTPEICLHDNFSPVLSLDTHDSGRFCTAGADHNVRVWELSDDRGNDGCPRIRFLSNIAFHSQSVNVVRWSPDGQSLASASDDGWVVLWRLKTDKDEPAVAPATDEQKGGNEQPTAVDELKQQQDTTSEVKRECAGDSAVEGAAVRPDAEKDEVKTAVVDVLDGDVVEEKQTAAAQDSKDEASDDDVILFTPVSPSRATPTAEAVLAVTPSSLSPSPQPSPLPFGSDGSSGFDFQSLNVEQYERARQLRGHLSEVYALSWSPSSSLLVTGSIDGQLRMWDGKEGKALGWMEDHHGYVQGVGYDPLGALIVSESSDRSVKVYTLARAAKGKSKTALDTKLLHTLARRGKKDSKPAADAEDSDVIVIHKPVDDASNSPPPSPPSAASPPRPAEASPAPVSSSSSPPSPAAAPSLPLFLDETLPSFFRRPSWSPDGLFLLLPAGVYQDCGKNAFCSWLYHRDDFSQPAACIPHPEPSVACAFSPYPYRAPPAAPSASSAASSTGTACSLPHCYLFVVATTKSLLLYSTHSFAPVAHLTNLHLTALTDIAWCKRRQQPQQEQQADQADSSFVLQSTVERVLVSSSDGYISVVELDGVAERLSAEDEQRWRDELDARRDAVAKRLEAGGSAEHLKPGKKRRKKQGLNTDSAQPLPLSADVKADAVAEDTGKDEKKDDAAAAEEGKREKDVKARKKRGRPPFVVTEETKARLTAMAAKGDKVTADAVKELLAVSRHKALKAIRLWKEARGDSDTNKDNKLKTKTAKQTDDTKPEDKTTKQHEVAQGDEFKDGAVAVLPDAVAVVQADKHDSRPSKKKQQRKAPIVPVEDAKKSMKTLETFFTRSAAPIFLTPSTPAKRPPPATPPSSAGVAAPSGGGGDALPVAVPVPAGGDGAEGATVGKKKRIAPVLVTALTIMDGAVRTDLDVSLGAGVASAPASASKKGAAADKKKQKRKKKTSKQSDNKKQKTNAVAPQAAPSSSPSAAASAPAAAAAASSAPAAVSIDLTDDAPCAPVVAPAPIVTVSRTGSGSHRVQASPPVAVTVLASKDDRKDGKEAAAAAAMAPVSAFFTPVSKRQKRTIVPVSVADDDATMVTAAALPNKQSDGAELPATTTSGAAEESLAGVEAV